MSSVELTEVEVAGRRFSLELRPDVDATDLYWNMLWPASVGLGAYMFEQLAGRVAGRRVIELGCGAGLAGLVAASLGARVVCTDVAPEALELASRNAARNELSGVETAVVDWRSPPSLEPAPIVIGADILYFEALAAPLADTLARYLAPGGDIWLSDAIRTPFNALLDALRERGFEHRQELLDVEVSGRSARIGVYHVRRRARGNRTR